MILQELNNYYERLLQDPEIVVPTPNWSTEKAAWVLEIDKDGKLASVLPLISGDERNAHRFITMIVPEHGHRSGTAIQPFFLCDNSAYIFGEDNKKGTEKLKATAKLHHSVLEACNDEGARAICQFFNRSDNAKSIPDETRQTMNSEGGFIVFKLQGDSIYIHERTAIIEAWETYCAQNEEGDTLGQCAITGEYSPIARLFPKVSGVPGAQSAGASLVSFNLDSFESYGKKQAYNASISKHVAFNAGSALYYLFSNSSHNVRIGETIVLFWSDRSAPVEEEWVTSFLGGRLQSAESETNRQRIQKTLEDMKKGRVPDGCNPEIRFFILGIAPNAARLSVRFFEESTFGALAKHHGEYLRDLEMIGVWPKALPALLCQTAPLGKTEDIPSTLINSCMHAMLEGTRFPSALIQLLLGRMRADKGDSKKNNSSNIERNIGERAALMKACIVRNQRLASKNESHSDEGGLTVSLNKANTNKGYILGRLFAIMEKAQIEAVGDPNSTIRSKYIGTASSAPLRVYQSLLRNYQNHSEKLYKRNKNLAERLDREMNEAMELLEAPNESIIPKTLSTEDQVNFYVGYYQQMKSFWSKGVTKSDEETTSLDED